MQKSTYTEESIVTLNPCEHVRMRPGMYIGKLGDGTQPDDGVYILIKEALDNSIDEFIAGFGKKIELTISEDGGVTVRDYGRGIPLGSVVDATSKINTGKNFINHEKSIGMNGVGIKAVNFLSETYIIQSFRDGRTKRVEYAQGKISIEHEECETAEVNGTFSYFKPDGTLFKNFKILNEYVETMVKYYTYANKGLCIEYNGVEYCSKDGLLDIYRENASYELLYEPVVLSTTDLEIVLCHANQYGEDYYAFCNGHYNAQGGTHQQAFREAYVQTLRQFYKKDYEAADVRSSIVATISIRMKDPVLNPQSKARLESRTMEPNGELTVSKFVGDFLKKELDDFLHRNPEIANIIRARIEEAAKNRKEMAVIKKNAKDRSKRLSLNNKKLRDCRIHFTDTKHAEHENTMLFITEGDSASGSITKSRNPMNQAVFSLRGKPLNTYGKRKAEVYTNEEFNLLQAALNIEDSLDNLRYNKIIIATDADNDGMHIRQLLMTFFLQFFPDLVRQGHLYILQTPLFRVRNKKVTHYCYSEDEKNKALKKVSSPEITRFKGLGEISPDEFKNFINENIRLDRVQIHKSDPIAQLLKFYCDENTPERQEFIINNLRVEEDLVEENA